MELYEKQLSSTVKYKGKVLSLREDEVELPDKSKSMREVVEHNGAVGVAAITENKEIILVKQFRSGIKRVTLELPAGKLEIGEEPLECGKRELTEETGYKAKKYKKLTSFATSPAILEEIIHLYLAKDLTKGEVNPDAGEFVETVVLPLDKAKEMVLSGEIEDGKTIIGILFICEYFNEVGEL